MHSKAVFFCSLLFWRERNGRESGRLDLKHRETRNWAESRRKVSSLRYHAAYPVESFSTLIQW
jgi:hypothetical protein